MQCRMRAGGREKLQLLLLLLLGGVILVEGQVGIVPILLQRQRQEANKAETPASTPATVRTAAPGPGLADREMEEDEVPALGQAVPFVPIPPPPSPVQAAAPQSDYLQFSRALNILFGLAIVVMQVLAVSFLNVGLGWTV